MINAFSVSRLKNYEECPYRALLLYGPDKQEIPHDPKREEALERGIKYHRIAEEYISGADNRQEWPDEFQNYASVLTEFRGHFLSDPENTFIETKWCLNNDLQCVDWYDDEAWARFGVDFGHYNAPVNSLLLVDWKTGKRTGRELSHLQQLLAYAACAIFALPDKVNEDTKFILRAYYFDSPNTKPFERESNYHAVMNYAQKLWHRGLVMTQAVEFPPKPNAWNCKYCPFSSNNSNICPYSPDFM